METCFDCGAEITLPDVEVFQLTARECAEWEYDLVEDYMQRHEYRLAGMNSRVREAMFDAMIEAEGITSGWFWWFCFPGCMPDCDPRGPFATRAEALADAQNQD